MRKTITVLVLVCVLLLSSVFSVSAYDSSGYGDFSFNAEDLIERTLNGFIYISDDTYLHIYRSEHDTSSYGWYPDTENAEFVDSSGYRVLTTERTSSVSDATGGYMSSLNVFTITFDFSDLGYEFRSLSFIDYYSYFYPYMNGWSWYVGYPSTVIINDTSYSLTRSNSRINNTITTTDSFTSFTMEFTVPTVNYSASTYSYFRLALCFLGGSLYLSSSELVEAGQNVSNASSDADLIIGSYSDLEEQFVGNAEDAFNDIDWDLDIGDVDSDVVTGISTLFSYVTVFYSSLGSFQLLIIIPLTLGIILLIAGRINKFLK